MKTNHGNEYPASIVIQAYRHDIYKTNKKCNCKYWCGSSGCYSVKEVVDEPC